MANGEGQERVGAGIHKMRKGLPFGLRELHTDNGGEFLNRVQLLSQIRRLEQELWQLARKSSTSDPSSKEPKEEAASPPADTQASGT